MARVKYQKVKLMFLYEILKQESSKEHPLTTRQLCDRLIAMDIPCERRTLSMDIAVLNELGFKVHSRYVAHAYGYYVDERSFSAAELKIMMDAVQAANFIPADKTEELVAKLASLGGTRKAELLQDNLICFNTRKHTNDAIYATVSVLETALSEHKKASFYYFDLNENREKVYRKDKERYVVDPIALVYHEDFYYLLCWSVKYQTTVTYRLDRMDDVACEKEDVAKKALKLAPGTADYTKQVFKMFNGKLKKVTLAFDDSLIGIIYDRFGEDTEIKRINNHRCKATVSIQISPTFWGWLFQFVGQMDIQSPKLLDDEYRLRLQSALNGSRDKKEGS